MRTASLPTVLALGSFLLAGAGCQGTSSSTTQYLCEPSCPDGAHCGAAGCVADAPPIDMAAPEGDLAGAGCQPPCSGATPFCNASRACVPCLLDADCPVGTLCRQTGATTVCLPGCNDDARCGGGANRCCNGTCVDSNSDSANCGACGNACGALRAASSCIEGACSIGACVTGWDDCNKDPADGCETNLRADASHCGTCNTGCSIANAVPGCSGGCYIAACRFGFDDCDGEIANGCETTVLSDAKNCGSCRHACPASPHARIDCVNASCQLTSCELGFADCDHNAANGCEVDTNADVKNCGRCDNFCGNDHVCVNGGCTCEKCNVPNAKTQCVNLECVFDGCAAGFADCNGDLQDGCEVNLQRDKNNCGACGQVCGQGFASCTAGVCRKCGNDCWGAEGCLTDGGRCIQLTCRAGDAGARFCDGCKGWKDVTYDQWLNQGYCGDVIKTYRRSNGSESKCGGAPACCDGSGACGDGDSAWHFFDTNSMQNYYVGPCLGCDGDVDCTTWNDVDNSNYTRLTVCEQ